MSKVFLIVDSTNNNLPQEVFSCACDAESYCKKYDFSGKDWFELELIESPIDTLFNNAKVTILLKKDNEKEILLPVSITKERDSVLLTIERHDSIYSLRIMQVEQAKKEAEK